MAELPLNEPAGVLVKTTCVDYPGMLAGSFFLKGCNLRCPYCYNSGLVFGTDNSDSLNTVQDLFNHLEKRQGILNGLAISGGEPLINPYTPLIIKKAKELGYKIKIDTNGTIPDKLEELLNNPELKPDFIAMDIKTSPDRYSQTMCAKNSIFARDPSYFTERIQKSISLLSALPPQSREWRTVLVPGLITKQDIENIAKLLPSDASWQFAQFQNKNCIDEAYNELSPYIDSEINELISYAQSFISGAILR